MFIRALILALISVCARALSPVPLVGDDSDCALYLTGPGRTSAYDYSINLLKGNFGYEGQHTCITYEAINQAYLEARNRILVSQPKGDWKPEDYGSVGELVLDISINLARRYGLTYEEIEKGLPLIDTSRTLIREVCPPIFSHVECRAGKYRRLDGLCNNLQHPTWGATNTPFQRLIGPLFSDGINAPRISHTGRDLPLSRVVSRTMHPDEGFHDHAGTVMVIAWGQFMDHDYTLTGTPLDPINRNDPEECCKRPPHLKHPYCNEIRIPEDDYFYRLFGVKCIDFVRAFPSPRPGCRLGSRIPYNTLTGVIDGNTVYGVTEKFSRKLRTGYGGLLRMNPVFKEYGLKDLLPLKLDIPDEGCTRPNKNMFCFEAGEIRVNEQLVLTVMHTLMAREHNRVAKALAEVNPHWDDETLFQEARRINIAEIQHITYNEFLPILLGKDVMEKFGLVLEKEGYWDGYDPNVNPDVIASFAAAAYRFGHSLLPTAVERWSKAHKFIASKRLSDLIRRPYDLYRAGVLDEYVMGLMNQVAQAMDDSITQEVTNHLFKKVGARFGMDLVSFNMQRGREFGLPGYMEYRKFCGLPGANSFRDLFGTMTNHTVQKYESIFEHPIDVDLWSGGVSERPLPGSMLGPTFACIIATQFSYSRRGDRFWFELPNQPSSFTREQLAEIRKSRLARVICDNTDIIDTVQLYPMVLPDHELNPRVPCRSGIIPSMDFTKWAEPAPFRATGKQFTTEAFTNNTNHTDQGTKNTIEDSKQKDVSSIEEKQNCDCNVTTADVKQKENCAILLQTIIQATNDADHNSTMDINCLDNAIGECNDIPKKSNKVSSDTILKYVIKKDENVIEPEKTKGHLKNNLRRRRSYAQNNPQPFAKAPLVLNYEISHPGRDVEPLEPQLTVGNAVRNSALANFNIETLHENQPNNKDVRESNGNLELQEDFRNHGNNTISQQPANENEQKYKDRDTYSISSNESEENLSSDENEQYRRRGEYRDKEKYSNINLDNQEDYHNQYRKKNDLNFIGSSEDSNKSKESGLYKERDASGSSEENINRYTSVENEGRQANGPLRRNSQENSNEEIKPLIQNSQEEVNKDFHRRIEDVDLDNFNYERIKVNENGEVEAITETHDANKDESKSPVINDLGSKSENYNEYDSSSEEKISDTSSSIENKELTHINDGEIKPVVEINSDAHNVEIIDGESKEKPEGSNESSSLETLIGVKENLDEKNDKLVQQIDTPDENDVKQQFERIPLDYKHDQIQNKSRDIVTSDIVNIESKVKEVDNDDAKEGTQEPITPKEEKIGENLSFKFDDISLKLPDIRLPDDILSYVYEEPVYTRKQNNEGNKESFYRFRHEDADEEAHKKRTDDEDHDDKEADQDYYGGYYGNNDNKQAYKTKKKTDEDYEDEDEDLYEKFVRERFGKKGGSFQKRSDKLQTRERPNPQLYKTLQGILQKTKQIEKEAEKSGDPKAGYMWTLEYGQNI